MGHYEADNRAELICSLANQTISLLACLGGWSKSVLNRLGLDKLYPVRYLHGDDYFNLLRRRKSALQFTLH